MSLAFVCTRCARMYGSSQGQFACEDKHAADDALATEAYARGRDDALRDAVRTLRGLTSDFVLIEALEKKLEKLR